ncbi:3-ketoacyl-ACP reductase [Deltaproteobacteria bacterium]|nr:3-ketoacyl-ACP reductase [Deltaproteobacteria bacterium]
MEIKGSNILITGGRGGFGAALAAALAESGANIIIFDMAGPPTAGIYQVDVGDEAEVEKALTGLERIDVLINCAGEIYSEPLFNFVKKQRHSRPAWDRVLNNNLTSCFNMSVQAAAKMAARRTGGVIINFSSISARGNAGQAAYAASKAGVEALTKVLAKEFGLFKIRAVAVAPGFIDTPATHSALTEARLEYWIEQTPLRRLGEPGDIVTTVKYIIECDYLSGCTIALDGALGIF